MLLVMNHMSVSKHSNDHVEAQLMHPCLDCKSKYNWTAQAHQGRVWLHVGTCVDEETLEGVLRPTLARNMGPLTIKLQGSDISGTCQRKEAARSRAAVCWM